MTVRVLRLTRHPADAEQVEALRRGVASLLGCDPAVVEPVEISTTVERPEEVVTLVQEVGAQALEAVLPLGLLGAVVPQLQRLGVPVLRAVMERQLHDDGTASYRFRHYEVVERVEVVTRPLA